MGLGGGKGRGGGKGGKGGKGGLPGMGMLGGLPIVGGMFNQGMGQTPGMMGSMGNGFMNGMNPMMALLGGKMGMPMRGMGPMGMPPWMQMFPGMQQGQGQGDQFKPDFPSSNGVYDRPGLGQPPQQGGIGSQIGAAGGQGQTGQGGGTMPALGAAPSGGGPFSFQPPTQGATSQDPVFGASRPFNPYAGGTPFTAPGGDRVGQFSDPRVNR